MLGWCGLEEEEHFTITSTLFKKAEGAFITSLLLDYIYLYIDIEVALDTFIIWDTPFQYKQ